MKLKTPLEIGKMSRDELINYMDKLHSSLRKYQIVIDLAVQMNQKIDQYEENK